MRGLLLALLTFTLATVSCTSSEKKGSSPSEGYSGHGARAIEASVVQRFAPPPLPSRIANYIQNILEITEPGVGVLSPDGKTLYFTWNVSGTRQVWKSDGPLRFPIQLTSGQDATSIFDVTPQEGKYLILTRDRGGEEDPGIYLLPTAGGPLIEVQHKKGVRSRPVWVANDGDTLFFTANDIKPDSYALYSYTISTGKKELLFSEPGLWFVADVQGDTRFLLGRMTGSRTREYFVFSTQTQKLEPVIGQGELEEYFVSFSVAPDTYFVLTPKLGDFRRLYKWQNQKLTPITPDLKRDVESFSTDHRHARLYIQWNEDGYSKLEVRDAQSLQIVAMPEIKGAEQIVASSSSRFGRYVGLTAETSVSPATNFIYDWSSKTLAQWARPSLPEIDTSRFQKATAESFLARDGTKIPMLVTRPKECATDPCPIVVSYHGGPESQSRPGFNRLAQIFAGAGYVFVEPNIRGSDGYGKKYRDADNGRKRLDVITDIEDCAKSLKTVFARNGLPPRIGVMGGSYGGYATLLAMTKFSGSYDAGVAIVGMSNLQTFLQNTASYRTILRTSEYGDPEKDRDVLEKLSPITYVNQVRDPMLIMQGVNDPRVPVGEAVQMHEALKRRGIEASLILFANEGHGAVKREDRVMQYGHALKFFDEHLLSKRIP